MYELTLTSQSGQLFPVAPGTRSDKHTLVVMVAGRSADPDRDYANVGHRLRVWVYDGEKALRTFIG